MGRSSFLNTRSSGRSSTRHPAGPRFWATRLCVQVATMRPWRSTTALIRNLGKLTSIGTIGTFKDANKTVLAKLADAEGLRKARVHPMAILLALKVYEQGHGEKGKLAWTPQGKVVDALNDAFYAAFANVEPTGKRIICGVDVSGSMRTACAGVSAIQAAQAAAAMAMLFVRTELEVDVVSFTRRIVKTGGMGKTQRLDDVMRSWPAIGEGTDLAQPVAWALKNGIVADAFVLVTDSETWAGHAHPAQVLADYRRKLNPQAKLVVMATTASNANVCDPKDPLSFGIAGFDANAPQIVADFIAGRL